MSVYLMQETKRKTQEEEASMDIEAVIEKDSDRHGFAIIGGETEHFMHFASQRGKCNEINCANAVERNCRKKHLFYGRRN